MGTILQQPSLSGGELSPSLGARVDLARYTTSVKTARNVIVRPFGGLANRPGTHYVATSKTTGKRVRLVPFEFSADVAYVVEMGDLYMRFIFDGAQLLSGMTPVEVVSPYSEAELFEVTYTQSADVMIFAHPSHPPYQLRRLTATSFELVEYEVENGPFRDLNTDEDIEVYASAVTGTVTLTASSSIFTTDHVGGLFYLEEKNLQNVKPWESGKRLSVGNPFGLLRRSDGKVYRCKTVYNGGGAVNTGTVRPIHEKGVAADGDGNMITDVATIVGVDWEYLHSQFGIVLITGYTSGTVVTGTVVKRLPDSVVGGVSSGGSWSFTGDGTTTVFSIPGATSNTEAEYSVVVGDEALTPNEYTVNATSDTITFSVAPANGAAITVDYQLQENLTDIWAFGAWSEAYGYPSEVEFFNDRLVFAATVAQPQTMWFSKTGNYTDFGKSAPLQDDDAITATINARSINSIRDLVPLAALLPITKGGEWRTTAGQDDVLTPSTVGFKPQSYYGAASLPAIIIGESALFVQDRGASVRDIGYSFERDGYTGNELSIFVTHLLQNYTISDWQYQQVPFSTVWIVRSDGALLSLTYVREQQIVGWCRHETQGAVESVTCIPGNAEDDVYLVVAREVEGVTHRYMERLTSRTFADVREAIFLDSALTYDGRNTSAKTMTLTGSGWTVNDELTLTASMATFSAGDIDDQIWFGYGNSDVLRMRIVAYTSTTVVKVVPLVDVASAYQGAAITDWAFARNTLSGLGHLEGLTVGCLSDGNVQAEQEIVSGAITLPEPGVLVHVGLPYSADIETLELASQDGSLRANNKLIKELGLIVQETRGIKVGPDADYLDEIESVIDSMIESSRLYDGYLSAKITSDWADRGRVFIRQDMPLPMTVLGLLPEVTLGGR